MNSRHLQSISQLNATVASGGFADLVAQGESLHKDRISRISELIAARVPGVRLVLVSGPSAAGKTTTAIRLCRNLEANGITALRISTDDYFVGNSRNPRDAEGKFDYEHLDAVDRERLSEDLLKISLERLSIAGSSISLSTKGLTILRFSLRRIMWLWFLKVSMRSIPSLRKGCLIA